MTTKLEGPLKREIEVVRSLGHASLAKGIFPPQKSLRKTHVLSIVPDNLPATRI